MSKPVILCVDDQQEVLSAVHREISVFESDYEIIKAELTRIPKNTIAADDVAEKLFKLIDKLEDLDDVQKVYANFEISDETMERLVND